MGANAFYALYNNEFELVSADNKIDTRTKKGILLYDVSLQKKGKKLLYAKDYLVNCDLAVEIVE